MRTKSVRNASSRKKSPIAAAIRAAAMQGMRGMLRERIEFWRERIRGFFRLMTFRFLLALFGFVGLIFFFVGLSRFLEGLFATPGAAEVLVGATILSLSIVLFVVVGSEKKG